MRCASAAAALAVSCSVVRDVCSMRVKQAALSRVWGAVVAAAHAGCTAAVEMLLQIVVDDMDVLLRAVRTPHSALASPTALRIARKK